MTKFIFDKCCFCIDLRVGCFIIGYLELIVSGLATIGSIMIVASGAVLSSSTNDDERTAGTVVVVVGIITLILVAVLLTFSIVLLVGLHKRKPGHLKAYLIYSCIFLAITFILLIVNIASGPADGGDIASRIIGLLFSAYFIMVIRSYYYQMLDEATPSSGYNS